MYGAELYSTGAERLAESKVRNSKQWCEFSISVSEICRILIPLPVHTHFLAMKAENG